MSSTYALVEDQERRLLLMHEHCRVAQTGGVTGRATHQHYQWVGTVTGMRIGHMTDAVCAWCERLLTEPSPSLR